MSRTYVLLWLLVPVAIVAWHFGPGKEQLAADHARDQLRRAEALKSHGDLAEAAGAYRQAIAALPDADKRAQQRLRLAEAQAEIGGGEMVEGQERLTGLLKELESDAAAPAELVRSVRHSLAESSYYAAMIMRREGATPDDWLPEAERARQHFRLLAEDADGAAAPDVTAAKKNLEATIRLEQMDLSVLLAAAPPKKCPNCKNLCKRKKKKSPSQAENDSQQPGPKQEEPEDIRKQIPKNGAGVNSVDGTGS